MMATSFKKIQEIKRLHHQHLLTLVPTVTSQRFVPIPLPDAPRLRHLDQKVALLRSSAITRHQGPTAVASLGPTSTGQPWDAPSCCFSTCEWKFYQRNLFVEGCYTRDVVTPTWSLLWQKWIPLAVSAWI